MNALDCISLHSTPLAANALYASRRRLRAWPGGGGGGALSWTGNLLFTPLAADFGPGPEVTMERRSAGRGVCFVRPSPSYSGLARRRRRRRRAHPVGEFALYASRRRLRAWPGGGSGGARSWTGSLLCTLLGADFGPGPEGAAEGCAAGQEFGLYATRRRLRAWHGGGGGGERSQLGSLLCLPCAAVARRQRLREAQLDGEFAFYAPRRHLRAWPRGGGGGELSWTGNLYSTPRAADFGPGPVTTAEGCAAGR